MDCHSFVRRVESPKIRLTDPEKNKQLLMDGSIHLGSHMQGHKTQHIPSTFWTTVGLFSGKAQREGLPNSYHKLDRTKKMDFRILAEVNSTMDKNPIAFRQLVGLEN